MSELPQFGADTPQRRAANASQLWEARQRTRDRVADQFDTIDDPDQIPVRRQGQGRLGPGDEFLQWAQPQEAAHDLDPEFPRQDLGADDVRRTDQGLCADRGRAAPVGSLRVRRANRTQRRRPVRGPAAPGRRRVRARPGRPARGGGARPRPQYPDVEIGAGDVQREGDAFGLTPNAERAVAAEQIEDDTPLDEVQPDDVRRTDDDGFELRDSVIDEHRSLFF